MKKSLVIRMLCLVICVFLAFTTAGCGDKTTSSEGGSQSQSGVVKPKGENSDNASIKLPELGTTGANGEDYSNYDPYKGIEEYKGKTVQFATWIDHSQDDMATGIENFQEKYGITVETVYCSQENYTQEVLALIQAGKSPDIIVENGDFPGTISLAQPIDVSGIDINEPIWDQDTIKALSANGKNYFVNTANSYVNCALLTVYNKDLLLDYGIKTPNEYYEEGDWTFANMKKIMQQVKGIGDGYYGAHIGTGNSMILASNANIVSFDGQKFTNKLTSSAVVDALTFVRQLDQEGLVCEQSDFVDGKAGLCLTDTYALKQTGYLRAMDGDSLGYCPLPVPKKGDSEYTAYPFTRGYGIAKGAKNPKAAGYFLRYILDSNNIDILGDAFWNEEAAQFYYDNLSRISKLPKCIDYAYGVARYSGSYWGYWIEATAAETPDPNQTSVMLQSHLAEAQNCVDKANKLLSSLK